MPKNKSSLGEGFRRFHGLDPKPDPAGTRQLLTDIWQGPSTAAGMAYAKLRGGELGVGPADTLIAKMPWEETHPSQAIGKVVMVPEDFDMSQSMDRGIFTHEAGHVQQGDYFGPFLPVAAIAAGVSQWPQGKSFYEDNPFELEAPRMGKERIENLENLDGRESAAKPKKSYQEGTMPRKKGEWGGAGRKFGKQLPGTLSPQQMKDTFLGGMWSGATFGLDPLGGVIEKGAEEVGAPPWAATLGSVGIPDPSDVAKLLKLLKTGGKKLPKLLKPGKKVVRSTIGAGRQGKELATGEWGEAAYRKSLEEGRGFSTQQYPHTSKVRVEIEGDEFIDEVKGLNEGHALWRASQNWPDAVSIGVLPPARKSAKAAKKSYQEGTMAMRSKASFEPGMAQAYQSPYAVGPIGGMGRSGNLFGYMQGLMERQMKLKEAMAQAQLGQMKEERKAAQQRLEMARKQSLQNETMFRKGLQPQMFRKDPRSAERYINEVAPGKLAHALTQGGTFGAFGMAPTQEAIEAIGMPATIQGLQQSGQIMGGLGQTALHGGYNLAGQQARNQGDLALQNQQQQFWLQNPGLIPGRTAEKGGRVPKTGTYKLHKDEIVLNKKQSDMMFPQAPKPSKGKAIRGYKDGTGIYRDPSIMWYRPDDELRIGKDIESGDPADALLEEELESEARRRAIISRARGFRDEPQVPLPPGWPEDYRSGSSGTIGPATSNDPSRIPGYALSPMLDEDLGQPGAVGQFIAHGLGIKAPVGPGPEGFTGPPAPPMAPPPMAPMQQAEPEWPLDIEGLSIGEAPISERRMVNFMGQQIPSRPETDQQTVKSYTLQGKPETEEEEISRNKSEAAYFGRTARYYQQKADAMLQYAGENPGSDIMRMYQERQAVADRYQKRADKAQSVAEKMQEQAKAAKTAKELKEIEQGGLKDRAIIGADSEIFKSAEEARQSAMEGVQSAMKTFNEGKYEKPDVGFVSDVMAALNAQVIFEIARRTGMSPEDARDTIYDLAEAEAKGVNDQGIEVPPGKAIALIQFLISGGNALGQ